MSSELYEPWCIQSNAFEIVISKLEGVVPRNGDYLKNTWNTQLIGDTAIIPIMGPIFRSSSWEMRYSGGCSIQQIAEDFITAIKSDRVKTIVPYFGTPGGQIAGVSECADLFYKYRNVKPVIGYVDSMACSAGYWLLAACSKIVINQTSQIGSIGVVYTYYKGSSDGFGKIISSQSPKKQIDPATPEGNKEILSNINSLADVFVTSLAKYRNTTKDSVLNKYGQGGVIVGSDGISAGMADYMCNFEELYQELNTNGGKMFIGGNQQNFKQKFEALAKQNLQEANTVLNRLNAGNPGNNNPFLNPSTQPEQKTFTTPVAATAPPAPPPAMEPPKLSVGEIQKAAYEQGQKVAIAKSKQILGSCNLVGYNDLASISNMVESQSLSAVQTYLSGQMANESEEHSIASGHSNEHGKEQNFLVEAAQKTAKEATQPLNRYGGEVWA